MVGVQIGELSDRAGVSARALRHYEQQGLLCPERDTNGYRVFRDEDVVTVARIRLMIEAGLSTGVARRYLDCVREGTDATALEMCPALRRELDQVAARLDREAERIDRTRDALCALGDDAGSR